MIYGDGGVISMNIHIHPETTNICSKLTTVFRVTGPRRCRLPLNLLRLQLKKTPKKCIWQFEKSGKNSFRLLTLTHGRRKLQAQLISSHINFMHNSTKMILKIFFLSFPRILHLNFIHSDRLRCAFSDGCTLM